MHLTAAKPDPKTAIKSATFHRAAVKRVIDEDTGERVGWMRPYAGKIEWSAFHLQGFEATEAEALKAIEAAVIEHRECEAADAAYVAEVMALPEPARTARRNRDKAAVLVEIERQRTVIRPDDLEMAEARLLVAESELSDAMAVVNRRAA
jgi:hypothetical protein